MDISNTTPPAMATVWTASPGYASSAQSDNSSVRVDESKQASTKSFTSENPGKPDDKTSRDTLDEAVSNIESFVQSIQRDLHFSLDSDSGRTVVLVTDSEGETIRQIPSEDLLRLAERLEEARSLLFTAEA